MTRHREMKSAVDQRDPWLCLALTRHIDSTGQVLGINHTYFTCSQGAVDLKIPVPISLMGSFTACSHGALCAERQDRETYSELLWADC